VFGFRLFIGFFVFLDQLHGKETTKETTNALVIPPYLDPLPIATGSGKITLTGRGQANATVVIYVDGDVTKKAQIDKDGTFRITSISLPEGNHTIKAKTEDDHGIDSEYSNSTETTIKKHPPELEITKPNDNITVNGDDNTTAVEGKTEEDADVRINDRYVVVRPDGTFSYPYPLQEGQNVIKIKSIDRAGNTIEVVRNVTYKK
jgi:hypothetical protein